MSDHVIATLEPLASESLMTMQKSGFPLGLMCDVEWLSLEARLVSENRLIAPLFLCQRSLDSRSIRCFFNAEARAPTSLMGFEAAQLLHFLKSRKFTSDTFSKSSESLMPQLNEGCVDPTARKCTI